MQNSWIVWVTHTNLAMLQKWILGRRLGMEHLARGGTKITWAYRGEDFLAPFRGKWAHCVVMQASVFTTIPPHCRHGIPIEKVPAPKRDPPSHCSSQTNTLKKRAKKIGGRGTDHGKTSKNFLFSHLYLPREEFRAPLAKIPDTHFNIDARRREAMIPYYHLRIPFQWD